MPEINHKALEDYLADLNDDQFASVYLIFGEELLCKTAFEALLEKLLPSSERNLNYEPIDGGAAESISEAIERVNTYSLVSGRKVVVLHDSRIFYSKQNEATLLEQAKDAFDTNELKRAAKLVANYLAFSGLSFEDLDETNKNKIFKSAQELSRDSEWFEKILNYCRDNNIAVPTAGDDAGVLQKVIEKGFPKDNHLIILTDIVDKRRRLFHIIRKVGTIFDCSVPKGARRADKMAQESVLFDRMKKILEQHEKTIDKDAYPALVEMTGFDLRTFSNNLEKLASYVGTRKNISIADVHAVLKRTKPDPVFELTNSVSDRNLELALFFLDSLLSANMHPLQILAALTNQIRKLLLIKGFIESPFGDVWHPDDNYPTFQSRVVPVIQEYDRALLNQLENWEEMLSEESGPESPEERKRPTRKKSKSGTDLLVAKNPKNAYPIFQQLKKAEHFTLEELIGGFGHLSRADQRLKSSGQNPKLILEDTIFRICRHHPQRPSH